MKAETEKLPESWDAPVHRFALRHQKHIEGGLLGLLLAMAIGASVYLLIPMLIAIMLLVLAYRDWEPGEFG